MIVQPGEPAPDFTLIGLGCDGNVSLADYRGRAPLFLALERGLWCPFCRRHIAHLGAVSRRLRAAGVETLAILASRPDRARAYLRFHPAEVPLAADPELTVHRAYRVPEIDFTPEIEAAWGECLINPTGELPQPVAACDIGWHLDKRDAFRRTKTDKHELNTQYAQLTAQFLIDRDGVVRWVNVETYSLERIEETGRFPSDAVLQDALRALPTGATPTAA